MGLVVTTAPEIEPLSLAEVKSFVKVDGDDENVTLNAMIVAARQHIEAIVKGPLILTTYTETLNNFPNQGYLNEFYSHNHYYKYKSGIRLKQNPVKQVNSIKYYDINGDQNTIDSNDYYVDTTTKPCLIVPKTSWPDPDLNRPSCIEIEYIAGYGSIEEEDPVDATQVPASIKMAMRQLIAHWFVNRETVIIGQTSKELEFTVCALLNPYIMPEVN